MNILVVGNGFDLAHGLPTTYMDFLFFCSSIRSLIEDNKLTEKIPKNVEQYYEWIKNGEKVVFRHSIEEDSLLIDFCYGKNSTESDKKIYNEILNNFVVKYFFEKDKNEKVIKEILYLVCDNYWIKYFLQCDMHGSENWIDFEAEISCVIKSLNEIIHEDDDISLYSRVTKWPNDSFTKVYFSSNTEITYKGLRDRLVMDLNRLIRLFEIYLAEYVEKMEINKESPDIKGLEIDFILSFNYTHTFSKKYIISKRARKEKVDSFSYIHGEADIKNTIDSNNMVLGIDEYLPNDRKNKDIEFIAFKKYYQRIHKTTGCEYKKCLDVIQKAPYIKIKGNHQKHYLYIFGHSLDVTDKDILRQFILNNNVYTTIYYRNMDQKGQQIANLVKVIGQDELIERTGGGNTRTIEFKLQQPIERIGRDL